MDETETKTCTNCKREIPAVNFTTHTVHCARNIKICPVCKEPVPHAELQEHHEKMHKLLPCKKCGESVCGTDLEDHIRDSCAHTIQSCRFCELELPRRELPAHEGYCGVRTEQCPECREWVMIKYRQLHRDSNHGFLRLDDDPVPQPKKELPKVQRLPKATNIPSSSALDRYLTDPSTSAASTNGFVKNTNVVQDRPRVENSAPLSRPVVPATAVDTLDFHQDVLQDRPRNDINRPRPSSSVASGSSRVQDTQRLPLKRTNDQPQINTSVAAAEKVNKDLGISRGAVKKRQAPKPPVAPPPDPRRDLAYYSAAQRRQDEERHRQEQTAINLAQGLPPVLSPLAKLERLRKMDALHNREAAPPRRAAPAPADVRHEFRDIKPMNPDEFMRRFQSLQMEDRRPTNGEQSSRSNGDASRSNGESRSNGDQSEANGRVGDRFSEIKSSLMALRRGLNEVTAPYNSWNDVEISNNRPRGRDLSPASASSSNSNSSGDDVRLPCEFCGRPILLDELVIHQTGCRPDLAQLKARDGLADRQRHQQKQQQQQQRQQQQKQQRQQQQQPVNRNLPPHPDDLPVIPCEFCTESLPVYLISEHQERCRQERPLLYPD